MLTVTGAQSDGTQTIVDQLEGATVNIDAGTRAGYNFDGWTSSPAVTFADATSFVMPASAVTITANWVPSTP